MFNKRFLLLLLIFIFSSRSFAQEWAPPGATWYYSVDGFGVEGYMMIEAVSDTVIDGQTYRVLVKTQHSYNHITSIYFHGEIGREYTYYEDNKVYIWRNHVVYTLYDFGAGQGTQWQVPYTYSVDTICDSVGLVNCEFSDTVELNGFQLNILLLTPGEGSYWSLGNPAEVIEYIGNTSYYLLPNITENCPVADLGEGGAFRCYHDDILGWYTEVPQGECDFLVGIEEKELDEVSVYPNPCADAVRLRYLIHDIGSLGGVYTEQSRSTRDRYLICDLFSVTGIKIKELINESMMPGAHDFEFDVSDLPGGIYMIRIQAGSENTILKLVVVH